jgi:uncharacterized repeat protein (TIGR01451 family)
MLKTMSFINGFSNVHATGLTRRFFNMFVNTQFNKITFLILSGFYLTFSPVVHASETVCDSNGGAGYPITDFGVTNLSIPFNFGDVSVLHDINVETDIAHTWVGDLTVRVTSPDSATQITVLERPGTVDPEFSTPTGFGCGANNIDAVFDDESANPRVENEACSGDPVFSGDYKPHDPAPNNLSAYDGENPNGNWGVYLSDSANQDTGTLNEVCLTVAFAAVTFDKWVSTDPTCSDTVDNISVLPGTDVYFCYTVSNPSTETFTINAGDATDTQGHNLSALETTYTAGANQTVIDGPIVAGTVALPVGPTVNNAQVIATFTTPNFTGNLTTAESATVTVTNPTFNTSTKTVVDLNAGSAEPGDVLQYTITINETAGVLTPNVQVVDVVDANLQSINVTTLPVGSTDNTVGNNIDITGITLPANGSATIVFEATIALSTPAGTNINNTATISHAPSAVSFDAIAPTVIISAPVLATSSKTELDVNGLPSLVGDLIRYTITINETGGNPATNITLTDTVDSNLIGLTIISLPVGAIDNTIGNNINITNISVAANGSVMIVFEANIIGSASVGTMINNTTTIIDIPSGVTVSPAAGTIIVGATPTSGNKQLYFNNLNSTQDLTRVAPTTNTNTGIFSGGNFVDIDQTPIFQSPFTISGGSTVTVFLNVRRRTNGGQRRVQVELFNGNTGALIGNGIDTGDGAGPGSTSQSWNSGATQYLSFQYNIPSNVTFGANDFVRVRVTNTSPNSRNIQVRSLIGGNISQVQMQSSTVVNIDTIGVFAAIFPATTQFPSYTPGSTVFIRATVSDPFGNADISGSNITITDSVSTVQINNAAMTSVATPSGATRVFEYQYTLPASPQGIWDLNITANEGTEGTVSHNVQAPMIVGTTAIEISKTSNVISDPVNAGNPKAIPNAIVEYTISVNNAGFGYADANSLVITDPLPANTSFFFGSPLNPVTFIDGIIPSGLTFNFISPTSTVDDVSFSNNGGVSFIPPNIDPSGFDITAPPINFISINPKGTFKGSDDGVSAPSFEIKLRVKVE